MSPKARWWKEMEYMTTTHHKFTISLARHNNSFLEIFKTLRFDPIVISFLIITQVLYRRFSLFIARPNDAKRGRGREARERGQ